MSKVDLEKFAKAIERGDANKVEFLLDSGAVDINAPLPRHANPPALVLSTRHLISNFCRNVFRILINRHNIDLDARDSEGTTCMLIVVSNGMFTVLRWLIEAGIDVNKNDILHRSYDYNSTVLLLAAGADVNLLDEAGQTPLHAYTRCWLFKNDGAVCFALIAGGADLDTRDSFGTTARELLAYNCLEINSFVVERARREIAKTRLDFVRPRALQVCIGLQSLTIPALQLCEILLFSCGPVASLISFHQWWNIATTVKHF